jgi:hypothetical protein
MLFNGGRKNSPHWPNKAFTYGCALEHATTSTHPLHVNSPNGRALDPCDIRWHCYETYISSYDIEYHGSHTFCFPSIKNTRTTHLITGIRVCNNRIGLHLQGYNWNLTPIINAIWQSKTSNTHKGFTFPSQGIWQWLSIKQHKATHFKILVINVFWSFLCMVTKNEFDCHRIGNNFFLITTWFILNWMLMKVQMKMTHWMKTLNVRWGRGPT